MPSQNRKGTSGQEYKIQASGNPSSGESLEGAIKKGLQ